MPSKLEIKYYGCDILTKKAEPVKEYTEEIKQLIDNMLHTMYEADGVGLAAPQVGKSLRIFVIDYDFMKNGIKNPLVFINPEITSFEGEQEYEEGCLSFPNLFETVKRFKTIKINYRDKDFKEYIMTASETMAVVIQHENDHLNGILLTSKMNPLRKMAQAFKLSRITDKAKKMTNEMVIVE